LWPYDKRPLISITLSEINELSSYAYGVLITKKNPIYSSGGVINMYQAWDGCSDSGLCIIDLMVKQYNATIDIGSVAVDMDNKMKILKVRSYPSTGYEIIKPDSDNAIEIRQVKEGG